MGERFMDLSRITFPEFETIANLAYQFFSPLNSKKYKEEHDLPTDGPVTPLSGQQFYSFLQELDKQFDTKIYKIMHILSMMERAEILTNEGHAGSVFLGNHYYTLKELSTCQRRNNLWLGEAFGLGYLQYKLESNVVHIVGENDEHRIGNGTGFLINNSTVLTCKHVVEEMTPSKTLSIMGNDYEYSIRSHASKDIAVLILDGRVDGILSFPTFSSAEILDEVLIMGYPPIPCADDAYMLSQRGEINAVVGDYLNKTRNVVLSSVTRPGNSGGPVISKGGYLVGMVTQFTVSGKTISASEITNSETDDGKVEQFPFYMAMNGKELFDGIKEIDANIEVFYEDYQ